MTDHEPFQREPQNPQDPQVVVFSPELLKLAAALEEKSEHPFAKAILEKAAEFSTLRADCVEWRIDCFEGAKDLPAIVHCAAKLRVALKDKLLLFTFRTKTEGGKAALAHEEYLHFIRTVLATDCADLIDIEFFTAGAELPALIEEARTAGAAVVCSSHLSLIHI